MTFRPELREDYTGTFKMEKDLRKGFAKAARQGQALMAQQYAAELIDALIEYIEDLEVRLEKLEKPAPKRAVKTDVAAEQS